MLPPGIDGWAEIYRYRFGILLLFDLEPRRFTVSFRTPRDRRRAVFESYFRYNLFFFVFAWLFHIHYYKNAYNQLGRPDQNNVTKERRKFCLFIIRDILVAPTETKGATNRD
jgi:hypothetical protein